MSREYGANMSMFNLRVRWAQTMLKEGASGAEVREIHGGFVLRVARDELKKMQREEADEADRTPVLGLALEKGDSEPVYDPPPLPRA